MVLAGTAGLATALGSVAAQHLGAGGAVGAAFLQASPALGRDFAAPASRPWAPAPHHISQGRPWQVPPWRRLAVAATASDDELWPRLAPHGPEDREEKQTWGTALRQAAAAALALIVGCNLSINGALAEDSSDVAVVEAALGFVKRNYYDQTFNNQDWPSLSRRYLSRVGQGESASSLTRELIASLGDRYSRVVDAATFEQLMAYDPLGVGIVLTRNENKEVFVSSAPFKDSSAAKAGLKQGDIVESVDGASFGQESLFAVMDRVAQADASEVRLVLRRGPAAAVEPEAQRWEVSLARARKSTPQDRVDFGVARAPGADGHRVGFLRLKNFGARSARDMSEALAEVRKRGADELVLDLRGNPGGSFQVALEVASLFLEPDSVATRVQTPGSDGDRLVRVSQDLKGTPVVREPLVILVDQGSASASEVLAAALRGNCRAPLLGQKTYGKAAVQGVFGLPNREAVALTVAKYAGPAGTTISGGLRPDGPGPDVGVFASVSSSLGLPRELSETDYASIDFEAAQAAELRTCRAAEVW